eukprot:SAG11_NODE_21033_length_433_cov_1.227545_2_plen_74_part_01
MLADLVRLCSKPRKDFERQDIVQTKVAAFIFCRVSEWLVDNGFFTPRVFSLYFSYLSVFLPYAIGLEPGRYLPS